MPNLKRTKEKKGTGGAQRAQMRLYCMPPPSVDVDDKVLFGAFPTRPFSIGTIPLVRLSWSSSRVSLAPARQANSALRLDPLLCRRALAWYPTSRGWRTAKQGRAGQGRAGQGRAGQMKFKRSGVMRFGLPRLRRGPSPIASRKHSPDAVEGFSKDAGLQSSARRC